MLVTDQSLALNETVQQMGFGSVEDFALEKAKESLMKEIKICMQRIAAFDEKYGIDYATFCQNFHQLTQPLFEKEEDSADWNAELKQLNVLMHRFSRLE